MAVRTGKQFLEGLRDGREVWLDRERFVDAVSYTHLTLPTICRV